MVHPRHVAPEMQEHPDLGPCFAHSGILAAAKAVWADLEEHGILQVGVCGDVVPECLRVVSYGQDLETIEQWHLAGDTSGVLQRIKASAWAAHAVAHPA